jgi:hypothetical protein
MPATNYLACLIENAHNFHRLAYFDGPLLDTSSSYGASSLNTEYILDRHQEGLINSVLWSGDIGIHNIDQIPNT